MCYGMFRVFVALTTPIEDYGIRYQSGTIVVTETRSPNGSWFEPTRLKITEPGTIEIFERRDSKVIPKDTIQEIQFSEGFFWDTVSINRGMFSYEQLVFKKDGTAKKTKELLAATLEGPHSLFKWRQQFVEDVMVERARLSSSSQ